MAKSYPFPANSQGLLRAAVSGKWLIIPDHRRQDQHPYIINPKYGHTLGFTHFQERLR